MIENLETYQILLEIDEFNRFFKTFKFFNTRLDTEFVLIYVKGCVNLLLIMFRYGRLQDCIKIREIKDARLAQLASSPQEPGKILASKSQI